MADSSVTKITITRMAIQVLIQALSTPGVFTDPVKLYRAGAILENLDDQFGTDHPDSATVMSEKDQKKWSAGPRTLELSPKHYDVLKECVKYHVGKGTLGANTHVMSLLRAFDLVPQD